MFYYLNRKSDQSIKSHLHNLNSITLQASLDLHSVIIISDTSIKNQVATLISHIHSHNSPVIKTIHHTVNVSSTEAKLFVIRCSINQATYLPNIKYIQQQYLVNSGISSKKIATIPLKFSVNGPFITQLIKKQRSSTSSLSSHANLHGILARKESDDILNNWKMSFQASDDKEQNFLELLDDNSKPIELLISKGGLWLKYFGYSNSLCARATRAIVNHTPIDEYHLRFFSQEEFKCLYSLYPIESRHHILHECKRYNSYWNLRRDTIVHFTLFLEFNSNAFSFRESCT